MKKVTTCRRCSSRLDNQKKGIFQPALPILPGFCISCKNATIPKDKIVYICNSCSAKNRQCVMCLELLDPINKYTALDIRKKAVTSDGMLFVRVDSKTRCISFNSLGVYGKRIFESPDIYKIKGTRAYLDTCLTHGLLLVSACTLEELTNLYSVVLARREENV